MPDQSSTFGLPLPTDKLGGAEPILEAAAQAKETVSNFGRTAAQKIDESRNSAADGLDKAASGLHGVAENLPGGETISSAAHAAADRVSSTAAYVRERDLGKMMADVEALVKNNPGPSLLAAGLLGFILGRALSRND